MMQTHRGESEPNASQTTRSRPNSGRKRGRRERSSSTAESERSDDRAVGRLHQRLGNRAVQRLVRPRTRESFEPVRPSSEVRSSRVQRLCTRCRRRLQAGKPPDCPDCEQVLRKPGSGPGPDTVRESAAATETEALAADIGAASAGGRPLSDSARSHFESRFGHDFGHVRVHDGARAARSNRRLNAEAFTLGSNIHFAAGNYRPDTEAGRRLLAHELSHVIQQRGASQVSDGTRVEIGAPDDRFEREAERAAESVTDAASSADRSVPSPGGRDEAAPTRMRNLEPTLSRDAGAGVKLRRFTRGERGQISNLDAVVGTAEKLADRTSLGLMRWGRFTAAAGGSGAWEAATSPESGSTTPLANRYLFTCRCGLLDMRHFYQLMYIGVVASNETATKEGREHELGAEPQSRFAPEDTASNALGAYFGSRQSWLQRPSTFVSNLRAYLAKCDPIDFATIPVSDQNTIVDFYAARTATGEPATPRQTAVPDILSISACGTDRAFPFTVEPSDPHRKTIRGSR